MLFSIELFPTSCGVRSRHPLSFSEKVCDTIDYHSRLTLCLSSWKERTLCPSLFQALEGLCQEREHPSDRCQGQGTGGRPRARRDGHLELAGTGQHMPGAARRDSVTLSPPSSTPAAPIPAPPHRGWAVRSPGPLRIPLGRGKGTAFGKEAEPRGSPSLRGRESPGPACGSPEESWLGSQAQQRS